MNKNVLPLSSGSGKTNIKVPACGEGLPGAPSCDRRARKGTKSKFQLPFYTNDTNSIHKSKTLKV